MLAGGVAHDLNNILSGLVSCPDILLPELPDASSLRELVQGIKDSGLKASAVVQDLLSISHSSMAPQNPVNLNTVITDYRKSLEFIKMRESRKKY